MTALEVQVTAKMADLDIRREVTDGHLVDVSKLLSFTGMTRRVFAAKASVEWTKEAAELSQADAERGTAMFAGVALGDVAEYALFNNGVIDKSQFFRPTNWTSQDWHQWVVLALCWDTDREETVAVFGYHEHMQELGLLHDETEGSVQ